MSKVVIGVIVAVFLIARIIETVLPDVSKQKGTVYSKWLFNCMLISGILIYAAGVTEFIIRVKSVNIWVSAVGLSMVIFKIFLKYWAMNTLGKFWSIQIEIRKNQPVVRQGPYKYVRHPAYVSTITEVIGGLLLVNAYYSLILACIIYFPLIIIRLVLEEKKLTAELGEEYVKYRKEVPMLIPYKIFFPGKTH